MSKSTEERVRELKAAWHLPRVVTPANLNSPWRPRDEIMAWAKGKRDSAPYLAQAVTRVTRHVTRDIVQPVRTSSHVKTPDPVVVIR